MIEACSTAPGSPRSSPGCSASDKRSMKRRNSSAYPQPQPAKPLQKHKKENSEITKSLYPKNFDKSKHAKKDKSFKESKRETRTLSDRRRHRCRLALPRAYNVSGDRSIFRCRRRTRFLRIFGRHYSGFIQGTAIIDLKSYKSIAQEA